jgi:hypothetical protein
MRGKSSLLFVSGSFISIRQSRQLCRKITQTDLRDVGTTMKNLNSLLSALSISIVACTPSTTSIPIMTESGVNAHAIQCTSMAECLQAAGTTCPNGYEKLEQSQQEVQAVNGVSAAALAACQAQKTQNPNLVCQTTVQMDTVTQTLLVVRCRGDEEAVATSQTPCILRNRQVRRVYALHSTKDTCNFGGDFVVGSDVLWPPTQQEMEKPTMGLPIGNQVPGITDAQCKMLGDEINKNICMRSVQWECTKQGDKAVLFTVSISPKDEGSTWGNMIISVYDRSSTYDQLCITEYTIQEVIK